MAPNRDRVAAPPAPTAAARSPAWASTGEHSGDATAFQLGEPVDPARPPLLSLRRILVGSTWDGSRLLEAL